MKRSNIYVKVGQCETVSVDSYGIDERNPILWRSLMSQIATVDDNGVVKAKRYGQTQIIAYTADNKAADTCAIMVTNARTFEVNGFVFDMIYVQGGTFWMGAQSEDKNGLNSDFYEYRALSSPVHQVTLSDYYIGETEVTQELWQAVMQYTPTLCGERWHVDYGVGKELPAYFVSWNDCQSFIDRLNMLLEKQLKGYVFGLPTEAQWEFAARGGIYAKIKNDKFCYNYSGSGVIDDVAWYRERNVFPVKSKLPNELGIYDMCGNVAEWCADKFYTYSNREYLKYPNEHVVDPYIVDEGEDRVYRGGSWAYDRKQCLLFVRNIRVAKHRESSIGLRLALYKKKQNWLKGQKSGKLQPPPYEEE